MSAGTDRCPGVDHRAFTDVCTDVDVARHQDDVLGDIRTVTNRRRRHNAEASLLESREIPAGELGIDLVEVASATAAHDLVVAQSERKQHRLLDPLVSDPLLGERLGGAGQVGGNGDIHLLGDA